MLISFSSVEHFRMAFCGLVHDSGWLPVQVKIGERVYSIDAVAKTVTIEPQALGFMRAVRDCFAQSVGRVTSELQSILFSPRTVAVREVLVIAADLQLQIHVTTAALMSGYSHRSQQKQQQWQLKALVEALLDVQQKIVHPSDRTILLTSVRSYLESCLVGKNIDHEVRDAFHEAVQCLSKGMCSVILRPKHDSDFVIIESALGSDLALETHKEELLEMRRSLMETSHLPLPEQTRIDLHRTDFRLNGDNGFDSRNWLSEHRCQPEETQRWAEIKKEMEWLVLKFFADMPVEVAMQAIVRVSQTELNGLYAEMNRFVHDSFPGWGILGKGPTETMIEVTRSSDQVVKMDYKLSFQPFFCGGPAGDMVSYNKNSSISVKRQIVITADAKPVYGPVKVCIKLDEGVLS